MNLEILSSRDKFWFHPVIALRYETTSPEISSVTEALRTLLISDSHVDSESVRVRFFQLSSFSLNIEVFAYVFAQDWIHFLEVQEQLLHGVITALQQFRVHFSFLPSAYIPADIDKGYSAPLLLREAKVRSAGAASQ